ncbi:hypothetical protein KPH14_001737 [Odynerus spinipes]|uniref:RNase NYN domain-containing protein n=1 Tax=Odynerus spinipes TaxID=1348599 RepID=A0AAD9VWV2_9HYME|nr:hypothetical protein KPH14_001737 [Odynerus spinipes]
MVNRSRKVDNNALKSQKKSLRRKKNVPVPMKKTSNSTINHKTNACTKITKKIYYESPIRLIKESKNCQVKKAKQSQKSNTCQIVPTTSLNDSVVILSDDEIEKTRALKHTLQNDAANGTIHSSLGELFKSFQQLRKNKENLFSHKRKRSIVECISPDTSCLIVSDTEELKPNSARANSKESSSKVLNETIDDIVVVWSSVDNSSKDKSVSNNVGIEECISDEEEHPRLFMLDYDGDSNNLKFLCSSSNNERQERHEGAEEEDNDLLFNKPGLKLPQCSKPNAPVNVQPQKSIRRISAKFYGKKSNTSHIPREKSKRATQNKTGKLREIIIDGCNVAMAYTHNKTFSEIGLKLVIDYFLSRGHSVKAFVPQHKRSLSHQLLEKLYTQGIVVFTPSRNIGGKKITPYDDRYILEYATLCKGIVISLDQYRDLYMEKPEWRDTIENRLLAPTFVGDYVMFPDDPLGRNGPTLEEFLRHNS